ncbi:hypothetical protein J0H58_07530 [bacterium]|nr:hypothetical protein [bacterium]
MSQNTITIECPGCHKRLRVAATAVGKTVRCPACGTAVRVTAPDDDIPVAAVAPEPPAPAAPPGNPFDFDNMAPAAPAAPPEEAEFFTVVQPFAMKSNRVYRVYSDGRRLVGLYVGKSTDVAAAAAGFGLIGGLIAGAIAARTAKANQKRQAEMAEKSIDELIDGHEFNFVYEESEIDAAEFSLPGFTFRLNYGNCPQFALLDLETAGGEKLRFALASDKDVRVALTLIEALLDDRVKKNDVPRKFRR